MASHASELLEVAERLLARDAGQRGRLSRARIRRSISTSYYALFHFLLEEAGRLVVGSRNDLTTRRRILVREITHVGTKAALKKVREAKIDKSVRDFLMRGSASTGASPSPNFVRQIASAFIDAQSKRHEADYDLNAKLSEEDAKVLAQRVKDGVAAWNEAATDDDRDFKRALCILVLLKGQLRPDP